MPSVVGPRGHDQTDQNIPPLKIGGHAYTGAPTAVADGDIVQAHYDEYGKQGVFIGGDGSDQTVPVSASQATDANTAINGLSVVAALLGLAPDGAFDRLRTAGDAAGGLGALLVSPAGHTYAHVTADALVANGSARVNRIVVNEVTTAGVLTAYDNTAESGTVIAIYDFASGKTVIDIPCGFRVGTGLYLGFDATLVADITVSYAI